MLNYTSTRVKTCICSIVITISRSTFSRWYKFSSTTKPRLSSRIIEKFISGCITFIIILSMFKIVVVTCRWYLIIRVFGLIPRIIRIIIWVILITTLSMFLQLEIILELLSCRNELTCWGSCLLRFMRFIMNIIFVLFQMLHYL